MSSRESLLDEAIAKAKEAEDWQLVEWLRMARGSESAARWYTERLRNTDRIIRKLLDENAKLRELCGDMYTVMVTDAANCDVTYPEQFNDRMAELGIEVEP